MNDYKNILVVRTDRIGDVVLTTPVIKSLREHYPDSKISILVTPATRELVDGNMCLDEVLVDDRNGAHKGLGGFLKLIRTIQTKNFDCAFVLHTKKRTNTLCFLSRIPVRIGYKDNKFGFLLNHPITDVRHKGEKHETQYCLDVLKEIGIETNDLAIDLPVKEDALRWFDQICQEYKISKEDRLVAIHPGASDPAKRWPEYRFAELMDELDKHYDTKIILIGGKETGDVGKKIIQTAKCEAVNLVGRTTVGQLAALLMKCHLLVSNDSGPVHVAVGVGTPVVSIFTRNQPGINPERWKPLGAKAKTISVTPEQSRGISFEKSDTKDTQYLELIPTKAVLEAVDALFKLC